MANRVNNKTNNSCQGKDTFERMNFLLQAGNLMADTQSKTGTLAC